MADRPLDGGGQFAEQFVERRMLVAGVGMAGASAARALLAAGADVLLTGRDPNDASRQLVDEGAAWLGPLTAVPDEVDVVVASPGLRPTDPLLVDAARRGVPVWGEVELAWRLRGPDAAPWLGLTGTNGKTTTVHMLESMLRAAGLRALAVGNVGVPLIDAVTAAEPYDVLAVELSSQQLHFAPSPHLAAGALLNLAPDHLDWHGTQAAYEQAKTVVWNAAVAIANADDARVTELFAAAGPAHRVTFTLGEPDLGQLGVRDGQLVSRAIGDGDGNDDGLVLAPVDLVRPAGRHNVANALAAAALARAHGVGAEAIAAGLASFEPDPHRNAHVLTRSGIGWVDDSKATNGHAARASLLSYERIVWIAGGQLKGASVDDLVAEIAPRLAGAVLLGVDRAEIAAALGRHAPDIPVIDVASTDHKAMVEVVAAAVGLARAGDTVLLAPAAASYDMFANYGARGDAFAAAARELAR